jgi:hypothetical protein
MSWAATAATIISSLVSATVTIVSNEKAADAAEDAALQNKLRADAESRNRELEAGEAIKRQRLRDQREKSAIRARLAQQGTLTTSGTPLLILGEVAANQELAIQDAVRAANMQSNSLRAEGTMGLWEAASTRAALTNQSIAAGIEGLSSAAASYSKAKYNGAFTPVKGA